MAVDTPTPRLYTTANTAISLAPPPLHINLDALKASIQEWYLFEASYFLKQFWSPCNYDDEHDTHN